MYAFTHQEAKVDGNCTLFVGNRYRFRAWMGSMNHAEQYVTPNMR